MYMMRFYTSFHDFPIVRQPGAQTLQTRLKFFFAAKRTKIYVIPHHGHIDSHLSALTIYLEWLVNTQIHGDVTSGSSCGL